MNLYNSALFAHVFAATTLFMAIAIEIVCLHRVRSAATVDQLKEWASLTRTTAKLLPISAVVILASGLYMGLTAWDLTIPWLGLSLAAVVVMFVVGPAVNSRRLDAIAAAAKTAPAGPIPEALARRIQDPVLLASIHASAALGFGIVFLKVVKPDLVGAVAALAVSVLLGVLSARLAPGGDSGSAEAGSITPAVAGERS